MPEQIRDGLGRGSLLAITGRNEAQVRSVTQDESADVSETYGRTFTVPTGNMTLNSTNEHKVLYMKNTDSARNLYAWVVVVSWNGGDTNHNRALFWSWYLATTAIPTARSTVAYPGNFNFTSGAVANIEAYKWDGTGDGMEVATVASGGGEWLAQGRTDIELHGVAILGLNDSAVIAVQGEEIGKFALSARIYFKDKVTVIP